MKSKLFRQIFLLMRPWLPSQFLGLFLTILFSITVFAIPLVSKYFIDEVIPAKSLDKFYSGILVFMAVCLAQPIIGYLNTIVFLRLGQNIARAIRFKLYSKVISAPMSFLDKRKKGKFVSRILSDGRLASRFVTGFFIDVLRNIAEIIMVVGGMFYLSAKITFLILFIFSVFYIVFYIFSKKLSHLSNLQRINFDKLCANIFQTFSRMTTIKSFGLEKHHIGQFDKRLQESFDINIRTGYMSALIHNSSEVVVVCTLVIIYWLGTLGIINGTLTLGTVIALGMYFQLLSGPFESLTGHNMSLQKIIPVFNRIYEYLGLETEDTDGDVDIKLSGDIKLSHVDFSYENGVRILNDISVKIPEKTLTAIAGPSGSGKSTLAMLLLGFYEIDDGKIYIGKHDISTLTPVTLRKSIGYVPQQVDIFNISILDNILIGNPKSSKEEIHRICKLLNIHDWIMALPQGYDTVVEESENISGGEKQRIGIARALVRTPSILVLDEPTSSLDEKNEIDLGKLLLKIKQNCSVIMISHKKNTLQCADQIIYMVDGTIKVGGAIKEKLKSEGFVHGDSNPGPNTNTTAGGEYLLVE